MNIRKVLKCDNSTVSRGPYIVIGCVLVVVKYLLVYLTDYNYFKSDILPAYFYYFGRGNNFVKDSSDFWPYWVFVFIVSLPFIYVGLILTVKRLRDIRWPIGLAILFFVPFLNFVLFLLLSILPTASGVPAKGIITSRRNSAWLPTISENFYATAVFVAGIALCFITITVYDLKFYGVSLFIAGPFMVGFMASFIYGMNRFRNLGECIALVTVTMAIMLGFLLVFGIEGGICIVMAFPILLIMGYLGTWLGHWVVSSSHKDAVLKNWLIFILGLPVLTGAEYAIKPQPPVFAAKTSVDIDAPASAVWQNVIAFPRLDEPTELLFRSGVAYPTHAQINGSGVGAMRYCHFSTGAFVEPITAWDENRLLSFDVTEQPDAMQELSPYNIHPAHLDGYFASRKGQFLLTELPNGKTRLEGTTWYTNNMWPQSYWKIWSDYIVHKIHLRVLEHIKTISERENTAQLR